MDSKSCQFSFRITSYNVCYTKLLRKVSSLFFNVTQGVLGSGFTDTKITNLSQPYDANYMVKCYDISGDSKMENKLSIIKGDEKINSLV